MCDEVWRENTEAKPQRSLASPSTALTYICLIDTCFDQILPRVIHTVDNTNLYKFIQCS